MLHRPNRIHLSFNWQLPCKCLNPFFSFFVKEGRAFRVWRYLQSPWGRRFLLCLGGKSSHLSKHFERCICLQQGRFRYSKLSSKYITHVDKTWKRQKKNTQYTSVENRNHTTKDYGVVYLQSGCQIWFFNYINR